MAKSPSTTKEKTTTNPASGIIMQSMDENGNPVVDVTGHRSDVNETQRFTVSNDGVGGA